MAAKVALVSVDMSPVDWDADDDCDCAKMLASSMVFKHVGGDDLLLPLMMGCCKDCVTSKANSVQDFVAKACCESSAANSRSAATTVAVECRRKTTVGGEAPGGGDDKSCDEDCLRRLRRAASLKLVVVETSPGSLLL